MFNWELKLFVKAVYYLWNEITLMTHQVPLNLGGFQAKSTSGSFLERLE